MAFTGTDAVNFVLLIVGVASNVTCIIVFRTSNQLKKKSITYQLVLLALTDSVFVVTSFFMYTIALRGISSTLFPVYVAVFILRHVSWRLDVAIISVVNIERCVAVFHPFAKRRLFTKRKIAVVYASLVSTFLLFEIGGLFEIPVLATFVFVWLHSILFKICPFIIMLSCSVAIIFRLLRAKHKMKDIGQTRRNYKASAVTIMLLAVTLTFLVLVIPFEVLRLPCLTIVFQDISANTNYSAAVLNSRDNDSEHSQTINSTSFLAFEESSFCQLSQDPFVYQILSYMFLLNFIVNCSLYSIFSRKFRSHLRLVVKNLSKRCSSCYRVL